MAVQQVTVLDSGPGHVRVHSRNSGHCNQCSLKTGCGHRLLDGAYSRDVNHSLRLPLAEDQLAGGVRAGDILELSIDEGRLMSLSLLQYGIPLLCMLAATGLASSISATAGAGEGCVIISAMAALGFGLLLVRRIVRTMDASAMLDLRNMNHEPGS
jgi:positive regulator of sigma E activity